MKSLRKKIIAVLMDKGEALLDDVGVDRRVANDIADAIIVDTVWVPLAELREIEERFRNLATAHVELQAQLERGAR